ncbi:hypothetical protein R3P38DRAFT_2800874 [Favolaschia claudopus]|uniref:Uncharacterized protein n=1 Tax=Favolaschia claudopus TaxID=2862362 RepID=A0AAV9ZXH0_9AGAR
MATRMRMRPRETYRTEGVKALEKEEVIQKAVAGVRDKTYEHAFAAARALGIEEQYKTIIRRLIHFMEANAAPPNPLIFDLGRKALIHSTALGTRVGGFSEPLAANKCSIRGMLHINWMWSLNFVHFSPLWFHLQNEHKLNKNPPTSPLSRKVAKTVADLGPHRGKIHPGYELKTSQSGPTHLKTGL